MLPKKMKRHTCAKQEQRTKCHLPREQFWLWTVKYEHFSGESVKNNILSLFHHTDHKYQNSLRVKQSKSVHLGGLVTLQCSLHSEKEEKRHACPAEDDVSWIRLGSGESHPSIIYTPSHISREREERSCFYSLSKMVNVSDKGTYYCAVDTCGQILFGGGTVLLSSKGNIFNINCIIHSLIIWLINPFFLHSFGEVGRIICSVALLWFYLDFWEGVLT